MFEQYNHKKIEENISKLWADENTYKKVKEKFSSYPKYYFLDGPPYATGFIHMGTAWNKILKDAYIRHIRMRGRNVFDKPGYDTHGTPIEVKVEKELGFKTKKDIESYGIDKFVERCRKFATQYIDVMNEQFKNLGVWMDFDNPYITLDNRYIEGSWHTFKVAYTKKLLYKGFYPVHVCPRCETAVAYNEIEYMKKTDPAIYVKFKLKDEDTYAVIWTTTPWTLPANVAIMVHPDYEYAYVRINNETLIIAKDLIPKVVKKLKVKDYEIIKVVKGEELEGKAYEHPFKEKIPPLKELENAHYIITNPRFVTLNEGTGLVHVAPGHGKEDYKASLPYKLPIISPLNIDGTFKEFMGELKGMFAYDANKIVLDWLKEKDALLLQETLAHDYPKCWRCSTPLLLMAVDQWFFKISSIHDKLLDEASKVYWHPDWAKKRYETWLENIEDWPISRQRYWGIPLPIWVCDSCGAIDVVGSIKEIKEKSGKEPEDLHRPYIDEITWKCEKCNGTMKRIPDVLDVWFDSGVASWAALGYPENKELFEELWPTDLQIEGADQIRGWWNSQLITSVITFDKRPFNRIIFHGLVLDAKGVKMSKSKGNVISPEEAIEKHGRDALRVYLLSSPPWNNFYFNWYELEKVNKFLGIYWNIYQFIKTYARINELNEEEILKEIKNYKIEDQWIVSELYEIINNIHQKDFVELHKLLNELKDFTLHKFSRKYIKLIRDRVAINYEGEDKEYAQKTLNLVMYNLNKLFAPYIPYLSEYIHRELYNQQESVHALELPAENTQAINQASIEFMKALDKIEDMVATLRQQNNIKSRFPVYSIHIVVKDKDIQELLIKNSELVKATLNTKALIIGEYPEHKDTIKHLHEEGIEVFIDTFEDQSLKEERFLKELIRHIQLTRKQKGKKVDEKVEVILDLKGIDGTKYVEIIEKETNSKVKLEALEEYDNNVAYKDIEGKIKVI